MGSKEIESLLTNSNFLIHIYLQPDILNLGFFNLT